MTKCLIVKLKMTDDDGSKIDTSLSKLLILFIKFISCDAAFFFFKVIKYNKITVKCTKYELPVISIILNNLKKQRHPSLILLNLFTYLFCLIYKHYFK